MVWFGCASDSGTLDAAVLQQDWRTRFHGFSRGSIDCPACQEMLLAGTGPNSLQRGTKSMATLGGKRLQGSRMTIAPTDLREAHLRVWALLESGLEAHASWRDQFLVYGLLATVGFDYPFDENDHKVHELAEQLRLDVELVVGEVRYFIRQNCLWTTDELVADMEKVVQLLADHGTPEEIVESLLDFSPYAKRPAVLSALRSVVAQRPDAEKFQSCFPQIER